MTVENKIELREEITSQIDHWVAKYPQGQQRSAVVAALLIVQKDNGGWISEGLLHAVADYLKLAPIEVFEVATFYDMYELKPIGKHKIGVCTNVACKLRGAEEVVSALKERLGVGFGETTADGQFTLRETECLAACAAAPVCQVDNEDMIENLTPEKMNELLDRLSDHKQQKEQESDA